MSAVRTFRIVRMLLAGALGCLAAGGAEDRWLVESAPLRFVVQTASAPSDPQAGVIAVLPDGGLLPRPVPEPSVYAADGQALKSEILWRNPAAGMALVFQPPPGDGEAVIYVRGVSSASAARSAAGFRPGLLLYTHEDPAASLETAAKLPDSVARDTDAWMGMVPCIGQRMNPFGKSEDYVSFYTGWFRQGKPARVYLCTVSDAGSRLRVDGKTVAIWPAGKGRQEGAKGQFGGWVDLAAGPHQIEYFHFAAKGQPEAQALWKEPGAGGDALPVMIPASAYLHSGEARIARATFRDGRPIAAVAGNTQAQSFFWFGDAPVNLFRFEPAVTAGNSPDTGYTWVVDNERRRSAGTFTWLFEGSADRTITLVATNRAGVTRVTVPVLSWSTPRAASVNNDADRQAYRQALLDMCGAVPADHDPCAHWSSNLWTTLLSVSEPYRGNELLVELFTRARAGIRRLKPDDRARLEDALVGSQRIADTDAALKWIDSLDRDEKNPVRKQHWMMERFDCMLYDRNDIPAARRQVAEMQSTLTGDALILVTIRLGDVERAAGNIDAAARCYGAAQEQYHDRARIGTTLHEMRMPVGLARNKDELKARQDASRTLRMPSAPLRPSGQSWRTFAVRESSFYETVRNLIHGGYLSEARDTLDKWELDDPLGKLSGDYPLAEAEFFMAVQHYRRAAAGLRIYRQGVDVSSWLPEAMGLELDALSHLKQHPATLELAREIVKRFPNHPVADHARQVIDGGG